MSKKVYSKPTITVDIMSTSPLLAAVSGPKYEGSPYVAPKEDQPYDFTNKDGVSLWEAE